MAQHPIATEVAGKEIQSQPPEAEKHPHDQHTRPTSQQGRVVDSMILPRWEGAAVALIGAQCITGLFASESIRERPCHRSIQDEMWKPARAPAAPAPDAPRLRRALQFPSPTDSIIGARIKTISSGSLRSLVGPHVNVARQLPPVAVAQHGYVEQPERLLRGPVHLARQQNRAGTRAKKRAAIRGKPSARRTDLLPSSPSVGCVLSPPGKITPIKRRQDPPAAARRCARAKTVEHRWRAPHNRPESPDDSESFMISRHQS